MNGPKDTMAVLLGLVSASGQGHHESVNARVRKRPTR